MKLLTDIDAGVHKEDDTILNDLQQKHPQPAPLTSDALLNGPVNCALPSYFDKVDKTMVFKSASMTKGVGGPSNLMQNSITVFLRVIRTKRKTRNFQFSFLPWLGY